MKNTFEDIEKIIANQCGLTLKEYQNLPLLEQDNLRIKNTNKRLKKINLK